MNKGSITNRTMKGMFWVFAGNGIQMVLQIITLAVLARLIEPTNFGLANAAMIAIGFMGLISQWIGPAVIQRKDLTQAHIRTAFTVSILSGLFMIFVTLVFAPLFSRIMKMDNLVPVMRVSSIIFAIDAIFTVPDSLLARNLRFNIQTIVQIVSYTCYAVMGVILALLKWGVWALVVSQLFQAAVSTLLTVILQPHDKRLLLEGKSFKELFYFGGGFTIAKAGNYFANNGDNFVVGRWLGEEALGLYSRAFQMIVTPSTIFGQVLDTVLFPAMSAVQDSVERLKSAYRRGIIFIAVVVSPISVLSLILAPEIIRIILGNNWEGAIAPFQILSLSILFRTSYKISDSLARATGSVYHRAWRQILFATLMVIGAWTGSHWGLPGVAWGVLLANIINFLLMAQLSTKLLGITWKYFFGVQIPSYIFSVLAGGLIWAVVSLMRSVQISDILVILAAVLLMGGLILALLVIRPSLLIGKDGIWALNTLEDSYSSHLPAFVHRYFDIVRKAYR